MEDKTKQQGGSGVGYTLKITWNIGSVNDEKRSCSEVKNYQDCYIYSTNDFLSQDICFWVGLKSTISLQAWAHQTASV